MYAWCGNTKYLNLNLSLIQVSGWSYQSLQLSLVEVRGAGPT
jgi:hypothetical protein